MAPLSRAGMLLGGIGALTALVPYVGLTELARALLVPRIDTAHVIAVAVTIVAGLCIGWLCTGLALWLTHIADHRLQASLRRAMVAKLGAVPLGWYSDKTSGQVRKAVEDDLHALHHLTAHHDVEWVGAIVLPLAGIAYLIWLDWRLALLAVATLPIYMGAYAWMMRGFAVQMVQLDASFAKVSAAIVEFVHGIAVVKAFGQTGRAHRAYRGAVNEFSERYAGWVRPLMRLEAFTSMALSVPVILLVSLSAGSWMIRRGWIAPLDLFAEVLIAVAIPQTLLALNQSMTAQRLAVAAAQRIDGLLATDPLPQPAQPRTPQDARIEFDGVSFGYDQAHPVLDRIALECRPGTITALVGASGAGKSTLAKLVPRFYDVSAGAVRIGGVDVREIAPRELYRHVGFVLQDVQLLHGSVADNLRLGRPDASVDAMIAAARAARIHERIMALPRGFDAVIGEDAVFSGGEAQRLSIARALLADAPILILDEATAHADPEAEAHIQDALSALARGRTVLVIAHRLASIAGADRIVVMDRGRIVESGTQASLLAANGVYARMWRYANGDASDDAAIESTSVDGAALGSSLSTAGGIA
ncbi:ABC transporter ATP-binding protein [Lysobacter sp. CA199]|uniref:ABC transporter ATP-binding protein n=1 Tax=Lysobacter sp. CA199 TaxID=3455608 RepID=UPI003F8D66C6